MTGLPPLATWCLRRLLPHAERDQVLANLDAEFRDRRRTRDYGTCLALGLPPRQVLGAGRMSVI